MRRTIFTLIMLCIATLTLQAQTAWTAAGSSTLFGSHWDETDTRNDLIDKGNGIWELTKTDCILEKNVKYNHGKTKSARIQKRNVFSTDKNEM